MPHGRTTRRAKYIVADRRSNRQRKCGRFSGPRDYRGPCSNPADACGVGATFARCLDCLAKASLLGFRCRCPLAARSGTAIGGAMAKLAMTRDIDKEDRPI